MKVSGVVRKLIYPLNMGRKLHPQDLPLVYSRRLSARWVEGWLGPRARLDLVAKRDILPLFRGSNNGRQPFYSLSDTDLV